jgi:hypothetical protein
MIAQSGITCVAIQDKPIPERWSEDMEIAATILRESGVAVRHVDV